MKDIRVSGQLTSVRKGDRFIGKRSSKIFEVTGYKTSPWGHYIIYLTAEDGEQRQVASFALGYKYDLYQKSN